MDKITLDADVRSRLNGLNRLAEMCDEDGNTLGFFVPPGEYHEMMQAWGKDLFADEDIAQAREELQQEGGYTTAEVLNRLQEIIQQAKGSS